MDVFEGPGLWEFQKDGRPGYVKTDDQQGWTLDTKVALGVSAAAIVVLIGLLIYAYTKTPVAQEWAKDHVLRPLDTTQISVGQGLLYMAAPVAVLGLLTIPLILKKMGRFTKDRPRIAIPSLVDTPGLSDRQKLGLKLAVGFGALTALVVGFYFLQLHNQFLHQALERKLSIKDGLIYIAAPTAAVMIISNAALCCIKKKQPLGTMPYAYS